VHVQLCLHATSGELLDADTSCCPGGFQCVLGSFCPHAAALLLAVAKQATLPSEGRAAQLVSVWRVWALAAVVGGRVSTAAVHCAVRMLHASMRAGCTTLPMHLPWTNHP
jgi:hypothetical protein